MSELLNLVIANHLVDEMLLDNTFPNWGVRAWDEDAARLYFKDKLDEFVLAKAAIEKAEGEG